MRPCLEEGVFVRDAAALLQVEGFPIHLSHVATRTLLSERGVLCGPALCLVAPAFCFMRPSSSLLMFLSMVACRWVGLQR